MMRSNLPWNKWSRYFTNLRMNSDLPKNTIYGQNFKKIILYLRITAQGRSSNHDTRWSCDFQKIRPNCHLSHISICADLNWFCTHFAEKKLVTLASFCSGSPQNTELHTCKKYSFIGFMFRASLLPQRMSNPGLATVKLQSSNKISRKIEKKLAEQQRNWR